MAKFKSGDAVQGVRNNIRGTVTEVHVGADSISYTIVSDEKQLLYAYECDLIFYQKAVNRYREITPLLARV